MKNKQSCFLDYLPLYTSLFRALRQAWIITVLLLGGLRPTILTAQVWTPVAGVASSDDFKALYFTNNNTGWVVGENGSILKTINGGTIWTLQTSGTIETLRGVFFWDTNVGWACGDNGTILTTSNGGVNWTPQTSNTTNQLNAVQFVNATTGWVIGSGSRLLKTINGGTNWTQQNNQGADLWGIAPLDANNVWVSGSFNSTQGFPSLLKTNNGGTNWVYQTNSGVSSFITFDDICFADANNGWVVGGNGIIRRTTDAGATAWTAQTSGTGFELLGIDFINTTTGFACGRQGVMFFTANGGTSWSAQYTGTTTATLWDIDMLSATSGFAVGDNGLILQYTVYSPAQPIVLLQPNGGEIFQIGTKRSIIWQVQAGIANVKIEYSTTNGSSWAVITPSTPAASGSYTWTVPNAPSVNCLVRVSNAANNAVNSVSAANFYIMNMPVGVDYSVLTSATVGSSPPQINVAWVSDANALSYNLDKKLTTDIVWTNIATFSGNTSNYTDNNVIAGTAYEYRVTKTTPLVTGYGYLYAGIEIPATDWRGTVLLVVDNTFSVYLKPEIDRLIADLIGDGWRVQRQDFAATATDVSVKGWLTAQYNMPNANVKALLIIGHLAIPYSGNFAPDGHAERVGAQPADVFYADIDGNWTDVSVATTNSGTVYTANTPGDGFWDPSNLPSPAEIQVGRIDMYNMTGFSLSEADLMKQYLNKNHSFRHKVTNPQQRALINTHLDNQLPSTSAVAWRSFSPIIGSNNIAAMNTGGSVNCSACPAFVDSLEAHSYLWTYMAGGGTDTSVAASVFTSTHCMNRTLNTVFMQLYGSYFVEWANGGLPLPNNLLRAPLANNGMTLATCWTGAAPRWYFQSMGLGESIGFATLQSQNNTGLYDVGNANLIGGVHMALMGDPTLLLRYVYPVSNLGITQTATSLQVTWTASADGNIVGYNIYRADSLYGNFVRINTTPVTTTSFTDASPNALGGNVYMVRALKLETTPSGSYYNMSEGIFNCAPYVIISGSPDACANNSHTYSAPIINNFTYQWTAIGGTIQSGQGTNTIQVLWNNGTVGTVSLQTSF